MPPDGPQTYSGVRKLIRKVVTFQNCRDLPKSVFQTVAAGLLNSDIGVRASITTRSARSITVSQNAKAYKRTHSTKRTNETIELAWKNPIKYDANRSPALATSARNKRPERQSRNEKAFMRKAK